MNENKNTKNEVKEIEDDLSEELESLERLITSIKSEGFEGPIPHPQHMEAYRDIDKLFPNRILKMAEGNLTHRHFMEKFTSIMEFFIGFLGWLTPTGISFYVLYSAVKFIENGKNIEALISLIVAITALAGAFYVKNKNT